MRTIKFRAWDKLDGVMISHDNLMQQRYGAFKKDNIFNDSTHILMQFTGLLDKNGKEIYEGDIVKMSSGRIQQIRWSNEECRWIAYDVDLIVPRAWHKHYEVIGNIYENPGLFKE